jgi:hypothetical protein
MARRFTRRHPLRIRKFSPASEHFSDACIPFRPDETGGNPHSVQRLRGKPAHEAPGTAFATYAQKSSGVRSLNIRLECTGNDQTD